MTGVQGLHPSGVKRGGENSRLGNAGVGDKLSFLLMRRTEEIRPFDTCTRGGKETTGVSFSVSLFLTGMGSVATEHNT